MGDCVNCGGRLKSEWKFCIFCGVPIAAVAPAAAPAPATAAAPAAPAPPAPGAQPAPAQPAPAAQAPAPAPQPPRSAPVIPAAVRPSAFGDHDHFPDDIDDLADITPRRRIDIPMILGVTLGIAGIALIIYMSIVLTGTAE